MDNLPEELTKEIKRCEELKKAYDEIPTGAFASRMIENTIKLAEQARDTGDTVGMIAGIKELRSCK